MNEPKRLTLTNFNWPNKSVKETSEWVPYEDYLLLKAEIDQLKTQVEDQAKRCADYEDLVSHYKQQRDDVYNELFEWQPIETAPKDCKTQILAWCKDYDHLFIVNYTGSEGMWYVSCSEGYIRPTDWMPLPKPPTR